MQAGPYSHRVEILRIVWLSCLYILCQYDPWATLAASTGVNIRWSMFFEASFLLPDNELRLQRMKLDVEK